MFKNYRLVGAILSPFKKLTTKQKASLKQKRFKNRFALLLQRKRLIKFFYQKHGKISELEKKIDVALFRVNFFSSIRAARQGILHNKVLVNNIPLLSTNYSLKPGDIFELSTPICNYQLPKLSRKTPEFEVNYATRTAIYLFPPQFIATPFNLNISN